jgi:hypothetical protein
MELPKFHSVFGRIHSSGPGVWNSAASRNVVRCLAPAAQPLATSDRRFFNRQKHISSFGTLTLVGHTVQLLCCFANAAGVDLCRAKTRVLKSAADQIAWGDKQIPVLLVQCNLASLIALSIPPGLRAKRKQTADVSMSGSFGFSVMPEGGGWVD